jgi:hypothetical protein
MACPELYRIRRKTVNLWGHKLPCKIREPDATGAKIRVPSTKLDSVDYVKRFSDSLLSLVATIIPTSVDW